MPEWDGELYELIDEPRGVEHSFFLWHRDEVIILGVVLSKLCHEVIVAGDGLIHIVKTTVAGYRNRAFCVEVNIEDVVAPVNGDRAGQLSAMYDRSMDSLEETVIQVKMESGLTLFQSSQIYLKSLRHRRIHASGCKVTAFSELQQKNN